MAEMGARTLTVLRDAVLLALSLALASVTAGCAVQTVEEDEEELVAEIAEAEAELHEGTDVGELTIGIAAVSSDVSGRDEGSDPEPEPWEPPGGTVDGDGDPPDPGDPYAAETKSSVK
jgi:hypothetical protein